jgi:hypothetical protein
MTDLPGIRSRDLLQTVTAVWVAPGSYCDETLCVCLSIYSANAEVAVSQANLQIGHSRSHRMPLSALYSAEPVTCFDVQQFGRTADWRLIVHPCDEDQFFFPFFRVMEHRWNGIDRGKPKYSGAPLIRWVRGRTPAEKQSTPYFFTCLCIWKPKNVFTVLFIKCAIALGLIKRWKMFENCHKTKAALRTM